MSAPIVAAPSVRPEDYRAALPILLGLGPQIGMHMERHYTLGLLLNRVLDRVEQWPRIAVTFPPGLWLQIPPSTTVHAMRPYVIDVLADHAYFVRDGDTRVWRYRWQSHCGGLVLRVEKAPPRVLTARARLEVYREVPSWCRRCTTCTRKETA